MALSTMTHTTIEVEEKRGILLGASIVACNTVEYSKAGLLLLPV